MLAVPDSKKTIRQKLQARCTGPYMVTELLSDSFIQKKVSLGLDINRQLGTVKVLK
jgi:hypothetical protein